MTQKELYKKALLIIETCEAIGCNGPVEETLQNYYDITMDFFDDRLSNDKKIPARFTALDRRAQALVDSLVALDRWSTFAA